MSTDLARRAFSNTACTVRKLGKHHVPVCS